MKKIATALILLTLLAGCEMGTESSVTIGDNTRYKALLQLNDSTQLPFIMYYSPKKKLVIENSSEKIEMIPQDRKDDTLEWHFPVFNSLLRLHLHESGALNGYFWDMDKGVEYRMAVTANPTNEARFISLAESCCSLHYPWEVVMRYNTENPRHALGEFFQKEDRVTGSIITSTGDYRFLEGILDSNTLHLATFDGKFAYYFQATLVNGTFEGHYFAGRSEAIPWKAFRNDHFELPSASSLTYIKNNYKDFTFAFPNEKGKMYSPVQGKVNLIQILGSWCPNCMDEARVLEKWYKQHHENGLEVIGLAFEYSDRPEVAWPAIHKMRTDLKLTYPIVLAGKATPEATAEALPMLNKVMAYPTLIVVDRTGNVRLIKTGFKGPGTSYFQAYKREMESLINELLHE